MLVSIVEESEIPVVHDETPLQPRPWSANMHPTRYIDGIANQEDGLSQSINRFRQHTIRAKLLHQSRLRPLEMEYQHSMGTNHLTVSVTTCPSTIAPATTMQEHASQFQRWYPSRQAPPLDHATGMFMQPNEEDNPVRDLQTWHTALFHMYQYHRIGEYLIVVNLRIKIGPGRRSVIPESIHEALWSPACSKSTTA